RPADTFRRALTVISETLAFPGQVPQVANRFEWNADLLEYGHIVFNGWDDQARMRLAANTIPTMSTMSDVLNYAVNHGLAFNIGVPLRHFDKWTPKQITTLERKGARNYYVTGFIETSLSANLDISSIPAYLVKLADLLFRPHARAFIGLGGPYSWVARRFGGVELLSLYMSGPSIQVTRHYRGANDSDQILYLGIHWDEVSEAEKNILLGYVPSEKGSAERWMFPPPEVLEDRCNHWAGIWNPALEALYNHIASKIESKKAKPLSQTEWTKVFRPFNDRYAAYKPSSENIEEIRLICERYLVPTDWDRMALKKIQIPEYRIL
ncbi:hypothetical protein GALMADRAFT_80099, partial [Galerina marginata CBS 339.88]